MTKDKSNSAHFVLTKFLYHRFLSFLSNDVKKHVEFNGVGVFLKNGTYKIILLKKPVNGRYFINTFSMQNHNRYRSSIIEFEVSCYKSS